ncbi:hypothetical protein [Bradyrhizobium sp. USDA 3458]|uniref:hypothetical protein n=1 Tax=Bradyrhizobium sp. USDA 3458 TaxID=2591461 RepID=UPI0011414DC9|nr:hypothetical protein [Bradyrhizobium sp. USDA 3458]
MSEIADGFSAGFLGPLNGIDTNDSYRSGWIPQELARLNRNRLVAEVFSAMETRIGHPPRYDRPAPRRKARSSSFGGRFMTIGGRASFRPPGPDHFNLAECRNVFVAQVRKSIQFAGRMSNCTVISCQAEPPAS